MLCDRPTFHIFNSLPISVDGEMSHMAPPTVSANYNNAYFQVRRSPRNKGSALSASLLWVRRHVYVQFGTPTITDNRLLTNVFW